jgi:hypothetical protein
MLLTAAAIGLHAPASAAAPGDTEPTTAAAADETRLAPARSCAGGACTTVSAVAAAVTASTHDGNVPANTLDDKLSTRWSANPEGVWIRYDFTMPTQISRLDISWHQGDRRSSRFTVQVSDDATTWHEVHKGASSGTTLQREPYPLTGATGRYLRIVGDGNTINNWTSITTVDFRSPGDERPPAELDEPEAAPASPAAPAPTPGSGEVARIDFESSPLGRYTDTQARTDFRPLHIQGMAFSSRQAYIVTDPAGGSGRVLEARIPKDVVGTGPWLEGRFPDANDVYLSYRLRFGNGFDFSKLGGKLPGLAGTAPHLSKPPMHCQTVRPDEGFAARHMWRNPGRLEQYLYHEDKPGSCGQGVRLFGGSTIFQANRWYTIQERVVMNTPGQRNGSVTTWVDGKLGVTTTGLRFRRTNAYGTNTLRFETYFGGKDVSTWGHRRDESLYFDDFRIWTP